MSFPPRSDWKLSREQGRSLFRQGDYVGALHAFQTTLERGRSSSVLLNRMSIQDEQITLSNVIACRLNIGGIDHARAAIEEAQECITLNPRWSKAHVRLASAYLCLGVCEGDGGNDPSRRNRYSNDACNALQTALQHDPNNRTARQMLVQELRRRDAPGSDPHDRDPPINPNYRPPSSSFSTTSNSTSAFPVHMEEEDESPSTGEDGLSNSNAEVNWITLLVSRVQNGAHKLQLWYMTLSNDQRIALHTVLFLLFLYIGFGGRFGWESSSPNHRKMMGNYGHDNVYEQYRREKQNAPKYSGGYDQNYYQHQNYASSRRMNEHSSYRQDSYRSSQNSYSSFRMSEMSGILYIGIMFAAVYVGRLYGLNPWQVLMMMRLFQGGGGGMYYHYGGGGWGRRRRW